MDIHAETHLELSIGLSRAEANKLIDELEQIFIAHAATDKIDAIVKTTEFKNLLTLAINNAR